jgi:hypothetical protein
MKFLILAVVLVATSAVAQSVTVATKAVGPSAAATQTANSAAGNVPVLTDGIKLGNQTGVNVILSAAAGQTLSGAGTLRFWLCDDTLARCVTNAELDITVSTSARRDLLWSREIITAGQGQRLYVEAVSVTSSSGALTVTLQTWRRP